MHNVLDNNKSLSEENKRVPRIQSLVHTNMALVLGFLITFAMVVIALTAPFFSPYDPIIQDIPHRMEKPNGLHPFGTDNLGRDVFTRVLYGTRLSLLAGFTIVFISSIVGTVLGVVGGYLGGTFDEVIMRITDIFLSMPYLILAMAIAAALGPGLTNAMIAVSAVWWPSYARLVRGQALSVRTREYIEAAISIGAKPTRIIFRHVLPNCWDVVVVQASLDFGNAIMMAAALGFLGLGAQPPQPEWGAMISFSRTYMRESWWMAVFPGLAIFITVLGFNLFGDGLRDLIDPRRRKLS